MQFEMEQGNNVLDSWPQEVQDKYEYLRHYLPPAKSTNDEQQDSKQEATPENGGLERTHMTTSLGWLWLCVACVAADMRGFSRTAHCSFSVNKPQVRLTRA